MDELFTPVRNFLKFDFISASTFEKFFFQVKEHIINIKTKLIKVTLPLEESNVETLNNLRSTMDLKSSSSKSKYLFKSIGELFPYLPLEYQLSQMKKLTIQQLYEIDFDQKYNKILEEFEIFKKLSDELFSLKHLVYSDGSEYFGRVDDTIKNGLGHLAYKKNGEEIYYFGLFEKDEFKTGILIKPKENTLYKGDFNSQKDFFSGMKIEYDLKTKAHDTEMIVKTFFFGDIQLKKNIYSGVYINRTGEKKNYCYTLNVYIENDIKGHFEFLENDKYLVTITDTKREKDLLKEELKDLENLDKAIQNNIAFSSDETIVQYSSDNYIIEYEKNRSLVKSIVLNNQDIYYIGELKKRNFEIEGYGLAALNNGDFYKGNFKAGQKEGLGRYYNIHDKLIYEGVFLTDSFVEGKVFDMSTKKLLFEGNLDTVNNSMKGKFNVDDFYQYELRIKEGPETNEDKKNSKKSPNIATVYDEDGDVKATLKLEN